MKHLFKLTILLLVSFLSCQPNAEPGSTAKSESTSTDSPKPKVPLERTEIKKEPVATFSQKTDNPLNDWYFSVRIYETPKTFHYLLKLQFEEIRGEDTLKLPNLGVMPEPVIRKGDERFSCIIGFIDHQKNFREYKKVYVKNNTLKITALKHYAVSGN